jgi:hypothetical protein
MKNILAENMLRFGPRNLSESAKRKLSKLVEQTDQLQMSNIALTDAHKNADTPQLIKSSTGSSVISFPTLGRPENGNLALNDQEGVITYLGKPGYYMVIGNIGKLENGTVVNPRLSALTFLGNPGIGSGPDASFGSAIREQKLHGVTDLPALTAKVAKMMDRNAAGWLKQNGEKLINTYKLAQNLGVDTSILDNLNNYNNQVNKHFA